MSGNNPNAPAAAPGSELGTAQVSGKPAPVYPVPGQSWDPKTGGWTVVFFQYDYTPRNFVAQLGRRAPMRAGDTAALPTPEANALIAAGLATATGATATQQGAF